MSKSTLEHLLAPGSLDHFLQEYWGKKMLHVSRGSGEDYFRNWLTLDDLDKYFQNRFFSTSHVNFVDQKRNGGQRFFNDDEKKMIGQKRIFQHLEDGNTLILDALDQYLPALQVPCEKLENELGFQVQCNVYITPPGNEQGFDIHYDDHDVFVLQVYGNKQWRIYDQKADRPTKNWVERNLKNKPFSVTDTSVLSEEFTLKVGDTLYIPKGLEHSAISNDKLSVHITLGMHPKRWFHLLDHLKELAENEALFRSDLPFAYTREEELEQFKKDFSERLLKLIAETSVDDLLKMNDQMFLDKNRPKLQQKLSGFIKREELGLSSVLKLKDNIDYHIERRGLTFSICFGNEDLNFPLPMMPIVEWIFRKKEFRIEQINGEIEDSLRLIIAKRLVKSGLFDVI